MRSYRSASSGISSPFDLHADTVRLREDVELLDPDFRSLHTAIVETGLRNSVRQGFNQVDMAGIDDGADLRHQLGIVHDIVEIVLDRRVLGADELQIDAHALGPQL